MNGLVGGGSGAAKRFAVHRDRPVWEELLVEEPLPHRLSEVVGVRRLEGAADRRFGGRHKGEGLGVLSAPQALEEGGGEDAGSGGIPGTRARPAPPAATSLRKIGRRRRRSSAWPAVMRRTPTPMPQGISSGLGKPVAPVRRRKPPSRRPDLSGPPIHPRFQSGELAGRNPLPLASHAAKAERKGRMSSPASGTTPGSQMEA